MPPLPFIGLLSLSHTRPSGGSDRATSKEAESPAVRKDVFLRSMLEVGEG